ncbi:helix-turn-helix domain-containing protein [Pseudaquidulcibacter saccharophilus]|uniref:helix-turn-helix domain-containing protein n=1 Tax=Pseudaquidulcibacter saccharophilus TaxID=2831900 RepID=UPI001EFF48F5|nr:helix-turn-helix domain-containing protein [Pseudaquidulcibacter saccharophilus]
MTPEEAQKLVDFARTKSPSQVRLRVVSSIDNPEADGAGAKLQQRRREMGLSVVQVAQALKLRPDQIAAIESMQFSRLPGLGYALGYVKAYAELLDFADIKAIVDDYKEAWSPEQKRAEENRKVLKNQFALPFGIFIGFGLIVWLVATSVINNIAAPKTDEVIKAPDEAIKEWSDKDVKTASRPIVAIDPIIGIQASRKARLVLRSEDGALVMDRYINPGENVSTDGLGRFLISADDAGAFVVNGYGFSIPVGAGHTPISMWRVPDLKTMADARAKEEEAAIAAQQQAEAAKAAKQAPAQANAKSGSAPAATTPVVTTPTAPNAAQPAPQQPANAPVQ